MSELSAVLIGGSAGSVDALQKILSDLPARFSLPIVVVQHLPANLRVNLDMVYGPHSDMRLEEAEDKMRLEAGHVYFAPASYHLLVEKDLSLSLSVDELVHFSRPSIDVLFESAAVSLRDRCAAILLTGANEDGAKGLKFLRERGAVTIVQDPATAQVKMMPEAALLLDPGHHVVPLEKIGAELLRFERADDYE